MFCASDPTMLLTNSKRFTPWARSSAARYKELIFDLFQLASQLLTMNLNVISRSHP